MTNHPKKKAKDTAASPGASDIYRKLEERAISESNDLNRRVAQCRRCSRGEYIPTVGSGHPLADILLVKYQPRYLEVSEGVAFYGRSGTAILQSVQRLDVDPLLLYGTNVIKCPGVSEEEAEVNCPRYLLEEFEITDPKIVVVMGERTLEVLNQNLTVGMRELGWRPGELQNLTPFRRALVVPDIDEALDEQEAKRAFWRAFRTLGDWYRDEPPY